MLLLALDTATPACAVAVCEVSDGPERRVAELAADSPVDARRSGELLAPTIRSVLAATGIGADDLGAVVVGLGPGPFTSLRIGIVTAASLGHALGIPVYGVCSLDAFAIGCPGPVGVASDARRRELYWATYEGGERSAGPAVARPPAVAEAFRAAGTGLVLGAGPSLYPEAFEGLTSAAVLYPSPSAVARVGARLLGTAPLPLEPLYLRRPDAAPPAPPAASHVPRPVSA